MARPSRARVSELAACCWIPLFPLKCEEARRPGLRHKPVALLAPDIGKRVWIVSPSARREGVRAGMTLGQAIGLCSTLLVCEPDPVFYEDRFAAIVTALQDVSPAVEPAELGRVYVGMDGMQGLYGPPERQVVIVAEMVRGAASGVRIGFGRGKFVSWVAAARAKPDEAVIVRRGEETRFLAAQPLAVLPLDADTHRQLRMLGLRTLGDLTALPEDAVTSQFGRPGRRLWRLAAGVSVDPVVGRAAPEPIAAGVTFFAPVGDRLLLVQALRRLIERTLKHPRRIGWRVQALRARAALEQGGSWSTEVLLKDPAADAESLLAPLAVRLEQSPPPGAVARLTLELTAFAPGTSELQLFARDAQAAARAGRRRALRHAALEIRARLKRPFLHHVIEVQPWSRLPERRYALIDYEP